MTLRIEILKVESTGDGIRVHGQGKQSTAPDWVPVESCTFVVPAKNRAAYYVGRVITIDVTP